MNPKWDSYSFLVRNYVNFGDESLKRINNNYTRFNPKISLTGKIPKKSFERHSCSIESRYPSRHGNVALCKGPINEIF
jgi:hypothetical protein